MKAILQLSLALAVAVPQSVNAWGALGHQAVGYVAMQFLSSDALTFVKSSLGSTYDESLGPASTWADSVRSTAAYKFSAPYHFIDAEDSPLSDSCSVSQSRDCGASGCILTAIQNYTARVQKTSLSAAQRQEALKFITHFIGDIGQPLHVEAYEVGGNDIDVTCSGSSSNLHSVWDTGMLKRNLDENYDSSSESYAAALATRISSGTYSSLKSGWVSCITTSALTSTSCPIVWATEANAYDCSYVFDYTSGDDLCTSSYYTKAIPIIDLQIAKQGYRLATWLNTIFG